MNRLTSFGNRGTCTCKIKFNIKKIVQDDYQQHGFGAHAGAADLAEFDMSKVFSACDTLKIFTVEFKDSLMMMTRPVGYNGFSLFEGTGGTTGRGESGGSGGRRRNSGGGGGGTASTSASTSAALPAAGRKLKGTGMANLMHVQVSLPDHSHRSSSVLPHVPISTIFSLQLGQVVQNSAVAAVLLNCPRLEHLHCYTCPDLSDRDLGVYALKAAASRLKCFYIYEAPLLTFASFQMLLDSFPELKR